MQVAAEHVETRARRREQHGVSRQRLSRRREGELDAVIGVSCLPALEKSFSRLAAESLPALAIPLLRDGCDDTDVDL